MHTSTKYIAGAFFAGLAVAGALFINDYLRREWRIDWRPGEISVFADPLYPPGRFLPVENFKQVMTYEPGYTDILVPAKYSKIKVEVGFENPDSIPVSIGVRAKNTDLNLSPAGLTSFEHEYLVSNLQNVGGRVQLIISAPRLREDAKPLVINSITVTYIK
ncbi:MAG: hypothetical protein WCJ29_03545 [bacterium]